MVKKCLSWYYSIIYITRKKMYFYNFYCYHVEKMSKSILFGLSLQK